MAVIDGIPVTNVARTLIDISGCAPRRLAERALDDALRRRLVKVPELWNYLRMEGRQGRNGAGSLRALLGEAIEADGYTPHSGRIPWSKDQTKDNAMAVLGWVTLRYTKYDMDERAGELIEEIRVVLEERLRILCP